MKPTVDEIVQHAQTGDRPNNLELIVIDQIGWKASLENVWTPNSTSKRRNIYDHMAMN